MLAREQPAASALCVTKSVRGEIDFFSPSLTLSLSLSRSLHTPSPCPTSAAENVLSHWSTQGQSNRERVALASQTYDVYREGKKINAGELSGELVELKLQLGGCLFCVMMADKRVRGIQKGRGPAPFLPVDICPDNPSFFHSFLPSVLDPSFELNRLSDLPAAFIPPFISLPMIKNPLFSFLPFFLLIHL